METMEAKWLGNMSKQELINARERYEQLVQLDELEAKDDDNE
jgi:hypothetical protein